MNDSIYPALRLFHILCAGIWVSAFLVNIVLNKKLSESGNMVSVWLKFGNLNGIVSLSGILLTGILMSIFHGYGFFNFASHTNHWLYSKQFITIIICIITFVVLIPNSKRLRIRITEKVSSGNISDSETLSLIAKIKSINLSINILVAINILLGLSRYYTK